MRRAVLIGVVAATLSVSLAACGGVRRNARVSGVVRLCGGPAPGRCFTESVRVSVTGPGDHVVARAHPSNGRFSFDLAPGIYTVSAQASGYLIGMVSIRALAGRTTNADITNNDVS
jgi:hypothetical protein